MNIEVISNLTQVFNGVLAQAFMRTTEKGQLGEQILPGRFGLARDLQLGALVRWQEGLPTYIFTIGTALALADAAVELVCTPGFMDDIGDSSAVELSGHSLAPRVRFQDYSGHGIETYCAQWPFAKQTMDGPRRILAFDLFDLAAKYIALHEQGHYLSGHLDLLQSQEGHLKWTEVGGNQQPTIDSRVLEIQADTFAAQFLTNHRIHYHHELGPVASSNESVGSYVLRCVTASMALVFALLEINDRNLTELSAIRTHPSSGARLLNVLRFAALAQASEVEGGDRGLTGFVDPQFFQDAVDVLNILGVDSVSEPDIDHFFGEQSEAPDAPRATEAFRLLERVPDARRELSDHAGAALHRLSIAAGQRGAKLKDDIWKNLAQDALTKQFGDMTGNQFQLYLMEAVSRSGEQIPWHLLGSAGLHEELFRRGEKYLRKHHPGVFFAE